MIRTLAVVRRGAAAEHVPQLGADVVLTDGDGLTDRATATLDGVSLRLLLEATGDPAQVDKLYAYYQRTEPMLGNGGRRTRGRRRELLGGALRHALAFSTRRSLSTNGAGRSDAVKLSAHSSSPQPRHRLAPSGLLELLLDIG